MLEKEGSSGDSERPVSNSLAEVSAVGFKYVVQSKHKYQQILWVAVLTLGFVGVFLHCFFLTKTFLSFPTMDVLSQKNVEDEFPSITICNNQPISGVNFRRYINTSDSSNKLVVDLYSNHKESQLFSTIGTELSKMIGHRFADVIIFCKFMFDNICKEREHYNWKLHQSRRSFNCYTINVRKEEMQKYSNKEVKQFTLIIYKELQAETEGPSRVFQHGFDSNNLMRISLHPLGQMPDLVMGTLPLETGTNTFINVAGMYFVQKYNEAFPVNNVRTKNVKLEISQTLKIGS